VTEFDKIYDHRYLIHYRVIVFVPCLV